jgi:hypothetical protein
MTTFTNSTTPVNTAASQFYLWAHPIAAFMAAAGWAQNNDTGQIVWPASIFNITDALGATGTVTFTGTILAGTTPLRVGSQVKVSGTTNFGTVASPIVYTITGGNLTTTFTAASATTAHDATITANTGWATVYILPTITSVVGNGVTATYQYTNTDGILCPGQSIVIPQTGTTGFTNTGFNGTYTVTSVTPTAFTVANATNASETKTVTGQVATLPGCINTSESTITTFPPAISNSFYEVWKMNDGHPFPVYLRINYGTSDSAVHMNLTLALSAGTDGAGNATGGSTGTVIVSAGSTGALGTSLFSGASNRLQLAMWTSVNILADAKGFVNIERAHDSSGLDTTTNPYVTLIVIGTSGGALADSQISIGPLNATVTETKPAWTGHHSALSGTFQVSSTVSSTLLAPAFPLVGAVGNPMIGMLLGASVDWLDTTQFSFSIYNTAHNYIANVQATGFPAGCATYDATPIPAIIMRYE